MVIKLKNKETILAAYDHCFHKDISCDWCSKTIKQGKKYYITNPFFKGGANGAKGAFCSPVHLKTASNAGL